MVWEALRLFFIALFLSPFIFVGVFLGSYFYGKPSWSFRSKKSTEVAASASVDTWEMQKRGISSVMSVTISGSTGGRTPYTGNIALRYFPTKKLVAGTLLLFGNPSKKRGPSMYDLGVTPSPDGFDPKLVDAFVQAGRDKLNELGLKGQKRRKSAQVQSQKHVRQVQQEATDPQQPSPVLGEEETDIMTPVEHDPARPVLAAKEVRYVGEILDIGEFPKDAKDEKLVFGVKLRLGNGSEYTCWGVDFLRAVPEADVKIGDRVAVTRIGRVQTLPGKNPMNLWEIQKL